MRIGDQLDISIHSPHAGRDEILLRRPEACKQFQSTLPMRGKTKAVESVIGIVEFQSTLPMRGETVGNADVIVTQIVFQSTLPMRGETPPEQKGCIVGCISIHSPHAGRDLAQSIKCFGLMEFQSTLPMRGETYPGRARR